MRQPVAGAAEAVRGCEAGLDAGGWLSTKVSVAPGGSTTRCPVATAVAPEGTFTWCPKPPSTELMELTALLAALCVAEVTLAAPLVTATGWPLMLTETSCVVQPDPPFTRLTAAAAPCGIVTPLPASTAFVTEARYCLPAGSLLESTASIILTATDAPAAGACACRACTEIIETRRSVERNRGPK
jgi:hypothetical protein